MLEDAHTALLKDVETGWMLSGARVLSPALDGVMILQETLKSAQTRSPGRKERSFAVTTIVKNTGGVFDARAFGIAEAKLEEHVPEDRDVRRILQKWL